MAVVRVFARIPKKLWNLINPIAKRYNLKKHIQNVGSTALFFLAGMGFCK
jgi:hypothetical protein